MNNLDILDKIEYRKQLGELKNEIEELKLDKEFLQINYRNSLDEISKLKNKIQYIITASRELISYLKGEVK